MSSPRISKRGLKRDWHISPTNDNGNTNLKKRVETNWWVYSPAVQPIVCANLKKRVETTGPSAHPLKPPIERVESQKEGWNILATILGGTGFLWSESQKEGWNEYHVYVPHHLASSSWNLKKRVETTTPCRCFARGLYGWISKRGLKLEGAYACYRRVV